MNAREELAELLQDNVTDSLPVDPSRAEIQQQVETAVDVLIAAGWSKDTYYNDDQLYDAAGADTTLPNDTVVESADGSVWRVEEGFGWDCVTGGSCSLMGPARLLVLGGGQE